MTALPPTRYVTRFWRLARLALHLARGMAIAGFVFPLISPARRRAHVRRWSHALLSVLAIRLHVHDDRAAGPQAGPGSKIMLVANHISWLDIFAINAVSPARFVAKSEVARWPLVGWLSTRAGTLYVHRARRHDTARINREVGAALQAGELVAVFPEGTTTDGTRILKFHSSLLEPAVAEQAAIRPIALSYWRSDGTRCTEIAYDGKWSLWDTLRRMVRLRHIEARLTVLPLVEPQDHRRILAGAAHRAISEALLLPPSGRRTERDGGLPGAAR